MVGAQAFARLMIPHSSLRSDLSAELGDKMPAISILGDPSIPTSWVTANQATQVAYLQVLQALFRTRTGDPLLTMEVLYQLS